MPQYSTRAQLPRNHDSTISRKLRYAIFRESAGCCVYCGWPAEVLDHIIPRSYGGTDNAYNLVAACSLCNGIAGDKLFDDVDKKREYLMERIGNTKYDRYKNMSICPTCRQLFGPGRDGATNLFCGECVAADDRGATKRRGIYRPRTK